MALILTVARSVQRPPRGADAFGRALAGACFVPSGATCATTGPAEATRNAADRTPATVVRLTFMRSLVRSARAADARRRRAHDTPTAVHACVTAVSAPLPRPYNSC